MADFGKATVIMELDEKKFDAKLEKVSKDFQAKVAQMATAPSKVNWAEAATGIKSVAGMIKSVFSGAMNAMSAYVAEYEQARAQEAKLLALMKNRDDFSKKMYSKHVAFARSLQETTNFADDQIVDAISQFQTFGNISQDIVQEATKRAADIAQTTGQDIRSVAIMMGKALDDPLKNASALRRTGIMFDENKLKSMNSTMERQAFLLAEIKRQYAGAAEGGQNEMSKFKNTLGDIKEEIGKGLLPVFAGLAKVILGVAQAASAVIGWLTNLLSSTTNISEAVKELNIAVEKYNQETAETNETDNLIKKYDELAKKTNRTAAEQTALSEVTQSLAQKLPSAVEGWDKYGKAIGIVSREAKNLVKEQREAANIALTAQLENTLAQGVKVAENWKRFTMQRAAGVKSSDIGSAFSMTGVLMGRAGQNTEEASRSAQELQKLQKAYQDISGNLMRLGTIEDDHIKKLYEIAKATKQTTLSQEAFTASIKHTHEQMAVIGHTVLSNESRQKLSQLSEQLHRQNITGAEKDKRITELANKLRQQENRTRQGTASSGIDWTKELEKVKEYLNKLSEINLTEIEIKIKSNFDEFEKAFKKYFKENELKKFQNIIRQNLSFSDNGGIEALFGDRDNVSSEMQKMIEAISQKTGLSMQTITDMVANIQKKNAKLIEDSSREAQNITDTFTGAADTLAGKLRAIDEEHRKAVEEIIKKEIDAAKRIARIREVNAAREQKKATVTVDTIKTAFESIKSGFDSVVSGIKSMQSGKVSGLFSGAGGIASGIGGVLEKTGISKAGGAVGAVGGLIGGIVSLFENEAETAQEKWQRAFDLTQARYNFELAKEKELTAQIQKRMEVYSYLEKIYRNNDQRTYEEQRKILEKNIDAIVGKFSQKGTITIGGVAYDVSDISAMQDEQLQALLEALKQNEAQFSTVAKTSVEYNMQQLRNAIAGGTNLRDFGDIVSMNPNNPKVQAYNRWVQSLRDTGYTGGVYTLWDLLDRHGNDGGQGVEDLNQNMQEFMAYFNNAQANAESLSGELETYIDQTDTLLTLEEQRTQNMQDQLNLQLKISDEVMQQLRALGNADINRLLDSYIQLETDIAQGKITGEAAYSARAALMEQISSILSSIGADSGIVAAMGVAQSETLKEYDSEMWNLLAGLGNIPRYAEGGRVTTPHLAIVGDSPETIIPDHKLDAFLKQQSNAITVHINNPVVRDDSDLRRLSSVVEETIWKTLKNIENRRGRAI